MKLLKTKNKTKVSTRDAGFTVIEALIATTILSILMVVIANVFVSVVHSGKQMIDSQKLIDEVRNVTFDLEKEVNEGNGISTVPTDCAEGMNPCEELVITGSDTSLITYSLSASVLTKKIDLDGDGAANETINMTSDDIEILSLEFFVDNESTLKQSRVTVAIQARPINGSKIINTQTTISEKNY